MPAEAVRLARIGWRAQLRRPPVWLAVGALSLAGAMFFALSQVSGWDPARPFTRNAPAVDEAIASMDAGDHGRAADLLEDYLATGRCSEGQIGVPPEVRAKSNAGFDLGLALFYLAEKFGQRFGEEESNPDGGFEPAEIDPRRDGEITCAELVTKAIAGDASLPVDLRARAFYLLGNLQFLRRKYEDAVEQYELALQLVPGVAEDADSDKIGRDAAWNRAIALRRLLENDAGTPEQPDADDQEPQPDGDEQPDDAGQDGDGQGGNGQDGGGDKEQEADGGGQQEQQADAGDEEQDGGAEPQAGGGGAEPKEDMGPPAEAGEEELERRRVMAILDELEDTPTYQQAEAKKRAAKQKRRVMEDK